MLARQLRERVPYVLALDLDEPSLTAARAADQGDLVDYALGDFRDTDLKPESFDFISCVATLHHMDAAAALRRMAGLLRPGGRLAIVGCARLGSLRDLPAEAAGIVLRRWELRRRQFTEVTAPAGTLALHAHLAEAPGLTRVVPARVSGTSSSRMNLT